MIGPYFIGNGSRKDQCLPIGIERNCVLPIMGYNGRFRKSHRVYDKALYYDVCAWCNMLRNHVILHAAEREKETERERRERETAKKEKERKYTTTTTIATETCIVYIPTVYIL